ncbi:MAG TPA: histidine kinase [Bacteroidales bacterium]|nr:histidine kinase [Bacteroidales bacterium]
MKHPVLQNRVRLIAWWLVWILLGLGQSFLFYFAYGSFTRILIPDIIISFLFYSGLALALWYPLSYFNRSVARITVLISNLLIIGAICVVVWVLVTKYLASQIMPSFTGFDDYWDKTFPYRVGTGGFLYGLVILTYYLIESTLRLAEKKAQEAKLESLVKETELKMLRSQINPHFLFNSLNSVSSLTVTDPDKARTMVIKLSEFMRYALSRKDEKPVTLQSELNNLRLYLDIEMVRFGDRLTVDEQVDPACLNALLPVMILQPLYENAIKHGVYESTRKVSIRTTVRYSEGFVEISIFNTFDPEATPPKGTGTGLSNVTRRLELLYGTKALLKTEKSEDSFTVRIFIPADFNT